MTINNAQLYWDNQDLNNEGWWLRYYDDAGTEQGFGVDGNEDASTESLAAAIKAEAPQLGDGTIKVLRDGLQSRESIFVVGGRFGWRAI